MLIRDCLCKILLAACCMMPLFVSKTVSADGPGVRLRMSAETGLPEIYFYHGMVLDQNFDIIQPTFENVSRIVRLFADGLANQAPDQSARDKYATIRKAVLSQVAMDTDTETLFNITLARWLLQTEKFGKQDRLEGMRRAIEAWATIPTREGVDSRIGRNIPLVTALKPFGLDKPMRVVPAINDYIGACKNAGVPIPPDWNDPHWQAIYPLDPSYSFVNDPNSIAQVWIYQDPKSPNTGVCIALPRLDKVTGEIGLFGIICQNSTQQNADPNLQPQPSACFWDNIDKVTGARLTPQQSLNMKISEIQDGSMLGENCTNCHRGENVINIHPKTALDLSEKVVTTSSKWVMPISGQSTWGNPLPSSPFQDKKQCGMCHTLPALLDDNNTSKSSEYCRILRQVVDKTMPKGQLPAGWLAPYTDERDIKLLRDQCEAALPSFANIAQ